MGATNTTTYYNLSQFVGTDKPAWLQDYNGDMLKIDTGINAAKVAADSAALDASAAQLDATTALNSITNTITPAITSLQTTVGNQGGAINTINSLIGNGTPTTTDQTIIGAINEINAAIIKQPDFSATPLTTLTCATTQQYYTATEDCWLNGRVTAENGVAGAPINLVDNSNNLIARLGGVDAGGTNVVAPRVFVNIFVKKGWRISYMSASTDTLTVFPTV